MDKIKEKLNKAFLKAASNGELEEIKYLISKGADIHFMNDEALVWAAENGHLDIVKYLVEQGLNIHAKNEALIYAAHLGRLDIVKYLVNQGANIFANNNDALNSSIISNYLEITKYLIDHGAYLEQPMEIPPELQDQIIENSLSSLNFITNLRPDLKEKYSGHLELSEIGL